MILKVMKFRGTTRYYVQKSYRKEDGKAATKNVEWLGSDEDLAARFGKDDPIGEARKYIARLTEQEKENRRKVVVEYDPSEMLESDRQRCFNGGYLFLQNVYHELGLDKICAAVERKHKCKYDLSAVLSMLVYTRIMYPGSKLSSLEDARRFIEQPSVDLHQVYRALSVLAKSSDDIQAALYRNSVKLGRRSTGVVYYDCTNYFFESEEDAGLRQHGHSKEGRPNPIVQMGLFTDMDGMPLAFCINPGNTAETTTLKPLEDKLRDNFGLSRLVVCTDGGLSSYENRKDNNVGGRSFITVQSLKMLEKPLQEWALETKGWHIVDFGAETGPGLSKEEYDLESLDPEEYGDVMFCRERWIKVGKKGKELEQRIIVSFSFKYRAYLKFKREQRVARAQAIISSGRAGRKESGQNNPKRYVSSVSYTDSGEVAGHVSYALDREMIEQEEMFDGFYAVCTNLNDRAADVIRVNKGRWVIEDCFRMMKTEFEARPVFLHRDDRIKAHFLTCFIALVVYKYLSRKVNSPGRHFTPDEILTTLRDMNFLFMDDEGYIPTYTRTSLTNCFHGSAGFRTDYKIVAKRTMRGIISQTKRTRRFLQKKKQEQK